ncbi:MAG: DUF4440 domain-containing protein [Gemmatimonadetes bacterium]|nr:DUF4440 domain-containing protein [Gemmatimonadota bacterium]NIQ57965.1 DUF4440 domain-containing protein [Gemmatimonadota bacterium]NIU78146.1 DUF4440 domain-containing protein [Gammaproteobacteria bacterium]NIX47151.1 DUF4440 domain-containing protein [Gemmatimonadota bacterium]NIY11524.1 DUF4440 domain-containing protein [Gemmatimonadota bacterium]
MTRHPHRLALLLAVPLLLAGCEAPEPGTDAGAEPGAEAADTSPAVDVAAVEQAIRDREAEWEQAALVSADSFAAFYTSDGVLLAPNAPPMQGPAAIAEGMGPMLETVDGISFETVSIDVAASGDLAVEQGRYSLTGTAPDGTAFDDEGSYLVVWAKRDGVWMVTHDIFNTDRPAPGTGEM